MTGQRGDASVERLAELAHGDRARFGRLTERAEHLFPRLGQGLARANEPGHFEPGPVGVHHCILHESDTGVTAPRVEHTKLCGQARYFLKCAMVRSQASLAAASW